MRDEANISDRNANALTSVAAPRLEWSILEPLLAPLEPKTCELGETHWPYGGHSHDDEVILLRHVGGSWQRVSAMSRSEANAIVEAGNLLAASMTAHGELAHLATSTTALKAFAEKHHAGVHLTRGAPSAFMRAARDKERVGRFVRNRSETDDRSKWTPLYEAL